jgi:hypothetical protein
LVAVSLSVIHLLVDWAKISSTKSRLLPDNALVFLRFAKMNPSHRTTLT